MKFKVGQKVRAKGDRWFRKGELVTIVELDTLDETYQCKGAGGIWWQNGSDLESLPQTLEDKLKLFKAGTHVLHTPTQEIYDKLMVELEKRGYKWHDPVSSEASHSYWSNYNSDTIVCCGYCGDNGMSYGRLGGCLNEGRKVLEIALEDFSDSEQEEHMKITVETDGHHKTTAECNGITAESLCNPADEFKLPKGVHMAVQRLLEKLEVPEEDASFHVGDIVEVVANEYNLGGNPIGLQGIVEWSNGHGANVKLLTRDAPLTFYNRELKLIRRGNN